MIVLLSTSDTDLLSARASGAATGLPTPPECRPGDVPALLDGADVVVVRILGGRRAWEDGLDAVLASGVPAVVLGGEQEPDAELMELSTVATGIVAEAHAYLAHGGPENLRQLARFLSDAVTLTGEGFDPPAPMPAWGVLDRPAPAVADGPGPRPVVAILYYRAHHVAGNTGFVHALADAVEAAGGQSLPVYCASLRTPEPDLIATLRAADAIVVTVLAAGGLVPAVAGAGGTDEEWDVGALAGLDVPILQGLCLTSSHAQWAGSAEGLTPLDAATQIAIPEFDGRLITVPFSFKEVGADGLTSYVPDPERTARVAGIAVRHALLRHVPPGDRRVALMLSAYPTKHARIGNAVGLDTPASVVALLAAMREAGYDTGEGDAGGGLPGVAGGDGDALIHAIIAAGGQDEDWLTAGQLEGNPVRIPAADYRAWFATLDPGLRDAVTAHWGEPPGELFTDRSRHPDGEIVLAALRAGNVVVLVQPPRGFGANPVAIYHDPDLPPSHHYLAAYHWLREEFGAHAVVHVGKHGNLEWLPGKTSGMSAACGPDAAIGDLPLIYPFLVNDPGEGTQAKRRVHATLIGHLVPPMARAESYGDIARLEQLMDEHAQIAALDPAKLPAIRAQIWTLIQAARLDHDLGLDVPAARRGVRRLPAARGRLAVPDQGRPDPRRPARAWRRPGRRRPGQPGAGHRARPADVGRAGPGAARPARSARVRRGLQRPGGGRRDRGPGPGAGRGHGTLRLGPCRGPGRRRRGARRGPGRPRCRAGHRGRVRRRRPGGGGRRAGLRRDRGGAPAGRDPRRDHQDAARARRRVRAARA